MPKTKKKFLDKKTATTFRLVHRSQRDPLIAAGEENSLVLAPIESTKNVDEERQYGIYYEDDYNYMQHLRSANEVVSLEPVEERFRLFADGQSVEAGVDLPVQSKKFGKKMMLPSSLFETEGVELETGLLNQAAPSNSLRLDWDLDVINQLEDDFDHDTNEPFEDDFFVKANQPAEAEEEDDDEDQWEDESSGSDATIGETKKNTSASKKPDDMDFSDFPNDHVGEEEETKSRFTEYSMTSSVLRRNQGLQQLDDEFEKLYEKYDEAEMGNLDGEEDEIGGFLRPDSDRMQKLIEQFQLQKGEKIVMPGGMSVRQFIGEESDEDESTATESSSVESSSDEDEQMERIVVEEGNQPNWDCESILSTNSTLYNHPSLIREPRVSKKIKVNPATGFPEGVLKSGGVTQKGLKTLENGSERSAATNHSMASSFRPKNECTEDRKIRKTEIRAIRRERRLEKKANNLVFKVEEQKQLQVQLNKAVNQSGLRLV